MNAPKAAFLMKLIALWLGAACLANGNLTIFSGISLIGIAVFIALEQE